MNKDLQEYLERIDKAEKKQEETARELDKKIRGTKTF